MFLYGITHKNNVQYHRKIESTKKADIFYGYIKCVVFRMELYKFYYSNCYCKNNFKITMQKSKSQFEVCFFCLLNSCRAPPVSDLNLPLNTNLNRRNNHV